VSSIAYTHTTTTTTTPTRRHPHFAYTPHTPTYRITDLPHRISTSLRNHSLIMPEMNHCVQHVSKCVSISISLLPLPCPLYPQSIHTHTPHSNTTNTPYHNQLRTTPNSEKNPPLWTDTLKSLIKQHYDRINKLEDQKYDLEYVVKRKDVEVHEHHQLFIRHLNTPKSILDQNQTLTLNNYNKNTFCQLSLSIYLNLYLYI